MIRWSATSLTDSGRGHSESDDVTALYLRLVPDLSTPSTPTTIESHGEFQRLLNCKMKLAQTSFLNF